MENVFSGLSLIIAIGAVVAFIMRLIGQPLLIGHIITGIIVGPALLHVAKSPETLSLFSDIGIALLLFIIGLGLNPKVVRDVGRTATSVGVTQVAVITILGWIVGSFLGLNRNESLFLGASLAVSSTIIILKLLSDKKEQARLYGKIAISVSLVQDIIAIALVVLTSAATNHQTLAFGSLFGLVVKAGIVGWVIYTISYRLLPHFQKLIAGSQEFLFLFAIAWGLGSAALFAKIGLSSEIGALLAGLCLAPLPYAQEIAARLRPLRDFFLIVFFISLGSNLQFTGLGSMFWVVVSAIFIAIIVKPLVAMTVMGFLGYTKRTSFKASVALAQVSEFSIVLIIVGQSKGLISDKFVSALVLVTLLTIAASTYMVLFSDKLFSVFDKYLDLFERRKTQGEPPIQEQNELILFGYHKGGHEFVKVFQQLKKKFVVIDYDPEVIDTLERKHINHLYGDITDIELLEEAGVPKAELIISTTNDYQINKFILDYLEKANPSAVTIVQADSPEEAAKLYRLGASYVILPHFIGSEQIGAFVKRSGLQKSEFKKYRDRHLRSLERQFGVMEKVATKKKSQEHLGTTIIKNVAKLTKAKA
jgi:Kef-type K+ transport system membrane component KefB